MKLTLLFGLILLINPNSSIKETIKYKIKHKTKNIKEINNNKKISDIVYIIRPEKGKKYASKIAKSIVRSSKEYNVPLEVIITTAYIESEFNMSSKPCVGIMQIYMPTYKEMDKHTGLIPNRLDDNIRLGTRELSRYYYHPLASRYSSNWRLRYTWGRYNGAGSHSNYVRRALKVYKIIKNNSVNQISDILKQKHNLWR